MNFQTHFLEGRAGRNVGLDTGIPALTKAIGGIQKKRIYGLAGAPKVGKSTGCDFIFILSPYEQAIINNTLDKVEWVYFCFETDRVDKEFKFAAHYMAKDHGIFNFKYEDKLIQMSSEYLAGKKIDDNGNTIKVSEEHFKLLKIVYEQRIVPLFGEYDFLGRQIKPGKILIITKRENPTGLRNFLIAYAEKHGKFIYESFNTIDNKGKTVVGRRIVGYTPNDIEKTTIIITDTIRKLPPERDFGMKQTVDKYLEYQVELRDTCLFTFVDIVHTNRNITAIERMKFAGEYLYPTGDDLKDTGNLSEDCNVLITMFNPNDEKYNLDKHFGIVLENYPNYRSIHIVESRDTECPMHIQTNMFGNVNMFQAITN